ncbi:hypothetical protein pipiens_000550, partial [Culex pipiens pipiens]
MNLTPPPGFMTAREQPPEQRSEIQQHPK